MVIAILAAAASGELELAQEFRQHGYTVFTGTTDAPETVAHSAGDSGKGVDLLVIATTRRTTAPDARQLDYTLLRQTFNTKTLNALRSVEALLPLMAQGRKRLCFLLEGNAVQEGSLSMEPLGNAITTAALTMACKNLHNDLRRDGYTVRLLDILGQDPSQYAPVAAEYFLDDSADDHFMIRDCAGKETAL